MPLPAIGGRMCCRTVSGTLEGGAHGGLLAYGRSGGPPSGRAGVVIHQEAVAHRWPCAGSRPQASHPCVLAMGLAMAKRISCSIKSWRAAKNGWAYGALHIRPPPPALEVRETLPEGGRAQKSHHRQVAFERPHAFAHDLGPSPIGRMRMNSTCRGPAHSGSGPVRYGAPGCGKAAALP